MFALPAVPTHTARVAERIPMAPPADSPAEAVAAAEAPAEAAVPTVADTLYVPPAVPTLPEVSFAALYCSSPVCDTQRYLYQICLDLDLI